MYLIGLQVPQVVAGKLSIGCEGPSPLTRGDFVGRHLLIYVTYFSVLVHCGPIVLTTQGKFPE